MIVINNMLDPRSCVVCRERLYGFLIGYGHRHGCVIGEKLRQEERKGLEKLIEQNNIRGFNSF